MKKTLFVSAIALVSIVLLESNFAGPQFKMATVSGDNFLNDTTPKKHKHHKDTASTPTDTAGITFASGNRILSTK